MMSAYVSISRVTEGMRFATAQRNLLDILGALGKRELELSSGRRVNAPSDDPLAAQRILNLNTSLKRAEGHERTIGIATQRLSHFDTVLEHLNTITVRAREIFMSQVGDNASPQTRANAALEVTNMVNEALALANRTLNHRHIFGGTATSTAPFAAIGNTVLFQGTPQEWLVPLDSGQLFASSISAETALGARSAEILGRADLTPALSLETRLADLNGGRGVRLGDIVLSDGTTTVKVNLRGASDLGDIADRLNATGLVTAGLRADRLGLRLESPGNTISVREAEEGHTAADLGLLASSAGPALDGGPLDAVLRATTLLSDLRGGAGLDLAGLRVANGPVTTDIDLDGTVTVGDLLSRINRSGAYVNAEINAHRNGLNLVSLLNGAEFTLEEAGGETAAHLGLRTTPAATPIERLNRGFGIATHFGPDFTVTLRDGSSFDVDVSGARTLADVADLINTAAGNGGRLSASFGDGTSLRLEDASGGAGDLSVTPIRGSLAARQLGIEQTVAAAVIDGEQLNPAGVRVDGIFNALITLRDALAADDRDALFLVGAQLDRAQGLLLDARADVGGRINRLEMTRSRLAEQKIALLDAIGTERDVDFAETTLAYQQEQIRLQAALQTTGMILSTSLLDFLR